MLSRTGWASSRPGVAAALALALLGGCGAERPAGDRPAAPPSSAIASAPAVTSAPATTRSPEERAAADALAAYRAFWAAHTATARAGRFDSPRMRRYGTDPLLSQMRTALARLAARGILQTGDVVVHPRVVKVDLAASPPTVTIEDCFDERGLGGVSRKTRKPVEIEPARPYESTATVIRVGGRWKVSRSKPHTDRPC